MRIVFVHLGSENFGIEYLASSLKKAGHEVRMIFDPALFQDKHYLNIDSLARIFDSKKRIAANAVSSEPDIIGFSVFTHNYRWALEIARLIKKTKNIPIIFGGIHPTILPDEVISNECVDMVCIGEGEQAMVELCEYFPAHRKDIKNIWFREGKKIIKNQLRYLDQNLDALPFPDKSLFEEDIDIGARYTISTSRGCPFNCSYCSSPTLKKIYVYKGHFLRFRSPDNVLEEIMLARRRYNCKSVAFYDDVFTINKERMEKLLWAYKKYIGLPFTCLSHVLYIDKERAKLLKESGCYRVELGIQSTNEELRKDILNRHENNSDIERALDICKSINLPYQVDHIFGLPGDTEQNLIDAANFYINHRPQRIGCFWLSYFPKTSIVEIGLQRGLIKQDELKDINDGLGKILHFGGSIKDKKEKHMIRGFEVLFKLIPLLPQRLSSTIVKKRWHRHLNFTPPFLILAMDVVASIKDNSYQAFSYMKYYLIHIFRRSFLNK